MTPKYLFLTIIRICPFNLWCCMPGYIDTVTDYSGPPEVIVAKLIASAFELSGIGRRMIVGKNTTPLTSGEKFVIDSLTMTKALAGASLVSIKLMDALKAAEAVAGVVPLQAVTQALTAGAKLAQFALETKQDAELGYRKPTAPVSKKILTERSAHATESMKTFTAIDLDEVEEKELYERVFGEEEPTAVIKKVEVALLKKMGGVLIDLDSQAEEKEAKSNPNQAKIIKAFEEGCKNYKPRVFNRPSEESLLLQAIMVPSKREEIKSKLVDSLLPENFPYNIDEKRFLKWIKARSAQEHVSATAGNESVGPSLIDTEKLKHEVETLKKILAKKNEELTPQEIGIISGIVALDPKYTKGSNQISMDAILTYIALNKRQNIIREDMQVMHDLLQDKNPDPAKKMQAIVACLPKLNEKGELATSINKELKKLESDHEFTEDLNTCYLQSYGFLHEKFLEKPSESEESKKEKPLWKRGEASDFVEKTLKKQSVERAFDHLEEGITSSKNILPNLAQVAAFMGLLSPEEDKAEIEACEVYLSMMQTYLHMKISETHPQKADETMSAVHGVLQNVANVSRSQRHVRLDQKSSPFNQANTAASATSTVLGVAATLTAPVPPLALALGVASGTISAAGSVMNWLQWSVSAVEKESQIVLPAALTLSELEWTVEGVALQLNERMEKSKALDEQGLNPWDALGEIDADIVEKIEGYRQFLADSIREIRDLQEQIDELKAACKQDVGNFHNHWQKLRFLNNQINTRLLAIAKNLNVHTQLLQQKADILTEKAKQRDQKIEQKVESKPSLHEELSPEPPVHEEAALTPGSELVEAVAIHTESPLEVTVHAEPAADPVRQEPEPRVVNPKDLNATCNEFKQRYQDIVPKAGMKKDVKHEEVEEAEEEVEEEEEVEVEETPKKTIIQL